MLIMMLTNLFTETVQIQRRLQLRFTLFSLQEKPRHLGFESDCVTTKNVTFRIMQSFAFSLHFLYQQHRFYFFFLEKNTNICYFPCTHNAEYQKHLKPHTLRKKDTKAVTGAVPFQKVHFCTLIVHIST